MRVNVYEYPEYPGDNDDEPKLVGWFEWTKSDRWPGPTRDGAGNHLATGEALIRTAKGRWVLEHWSRWQDDTDKYVFVSDDQARTWLLDHGEDATVREYFGEIEEERGPGRPEIGSPVQVRLGTDLLERVDSWASERGVKRAEAIRRLVAAAL